MREYRGFRINGWLQAGLVFSILLLSLNIAVGGTWKFVHIADTQSGISPSNAVNTNVCMHMMRQIIKEDPDLVLIPGDLIYGNLTIDRTVMLDEYAQWTNAMAGIYAAGIPIYPIRGNHETFGDDTNGTVYLSVFGASVPGNGPAGEVGLTYSFTHNNALFIGLDQYVNPNKVNQPWLNSQLASNRYPHVFVFGHEPAVQVVEPECLALENSARDLFLQSITAAGCRMYLCAHDHFYDRGLLFPRSGGSIMQVVSGAGGAPFETNWDGVYGQDFNEQAMGSNCYYSTLTNGYVLVTVSNYNVTMEWKGSADLETWTTYDTYSYQLTNPAIRSPSDFDGDRKSDPSVFDPAGGVFGVFQSGSSYALSTVLMSAQSMLSGVQPIPGDFDGDNKGDPAIYDPIANLLLVRYSSQAYGLNTMPIGDLGCVPVGGDFDGDGKTDPALYSAATAQMAVWFSDANYTGSVFPLGGPGWLNASADYDNDGKTDPAVYDTGNPSASSGQAGTWEVLMSANSYIPVTLTTAGGAGVMPAPGDYDGDGKADLALFQPATGMWLFALSGQNYAQTILASLAGSGLVARPGDYDNDGKCDPAVCDLAGRAFYVWLSGSNYGMSSLNW